MDISSEIFNILKGANLPVKLFDSNGQKTLDSGVARRFYSSDNDMLVTIREGEDGLEVVIQTGKDFSFMENKDLVNSIKASAHNSLAEFSVRKFSKNIVPKDFASEVVAEGYSKAHGSVKTSYIRLPESKIVIRHTARVNEEVRGSRSRNIRSIHIENTQGERFAFPYRYLQGARAMAMHVNMGGTPYDAIGESILSLCEEVMHCKEFITHVRKNKLVNEGNANVVEAVTCKMKKLKDDIRSLQTSRGYNAFEVKAVKEEASEVDITDRFVYNTFEAENLDSVLTTVARIVKERESMDDMNKEQVLKLYNMIKNKEDFKLNIDPNDPEHPANEDPVKYSGSMGAMAYLSAMLSFLAMSSKNDEAFNILSRLSTAIHDMKQQDVLLVDKMVNFLVKHYENPVKETTGENIVESTISDLRRKIS